MSNFPETLNAAQRTALTHIVGEIIPGSRIIDSRRLTGGVSADVFALDTEDADGVHCWLVLRQHGGHDWKMQEAGVVALEHKLLSLLQDSAIPVPKSLYIDSQGRQLGKPSVIMSFIEGTTDHDAPALPVRLQVMADTLAALHNLEVEDPSAWPQRTNPLPEVFDYLPDNPQGVATKARLQSLNPTEYEGRSSLLHGDFWSGNLLWKNGRLVGVLDWEDVAVGDPMCDLAGASMELLWQFDQDAADTFVQLYAQRRSVDHHRLALWSIYVGYAGLHFMHEWGLEAGYEAKIRARSKNFVQEAFARL